MSGTSKAQLRRLARTRLGQIAADELARQSALVCERVLALPVFAASRVVSVYLSMPRGEVQTAAIVRRCFGEGKRVLVPAVAGGAEGEMAMVELRSEAELEALPRNAWGIPEPPMPAGEAVLPDLILAPGLLFDHAGGRLGHGKGYYDRYIARCRARSAGGGVCVVALALREQLLTGAGADGVPVVEERDERVDYVVTPDEVIDPVTAGSR